MLLQKHDFYTNIHPFIAYRLYVINHLTTTFLRDFLEILKQNASEFLENPEEIFPQYCLV